jgi:hypothetical protein
MKTNCIGVAELLCAYADGELESSKIHIVEDHLLICENCSAILKLYGEISTAIDDTNVPAPEILRPGVMNRIQHEEIYSDINKIKKRKQYHFILTRFAPIAACLVIGLLIWQPWSDSQYMSGGDAMTAAPMAEPAFDLMAIMPAPEASEALDFESLEDDISDAPDADMGGEPSGENRLYDDDVEFGVSLNRLFFEDIERLQEHIDGAYAEITVTGELPELLEGYMPQAIGPWLEWDMVFEIPSTDISALLDELVNGEEFAVTRNNQNASSPYAIVFFAFKE